MTQVVSPQQEAAVPPRPQRSARGVGEYTFGAVLAILVLLGLALRFSARSPLWLDEAQSVAIARLPLSGAGTTLWDGLRQDGSPPLYYLLLHGWIRLFGTSGHAVRTLSALLNLACLPPLYLLARRVIGRRQAGVALLLFITSPFALYFATETRMYDLLLLLSVLGGLAVERTLRAPGPLPAAGVAVCSGLIALTHYWSLYLLATLGLGLVLGAVRGRTPLGRRGARWALGGVLAGGVVFAPWLGIFRYQAVHTGTPWGEPAAFAAVVHAFGEWCGGATTTGRTMLVLVAALLALAVFGRALGPSQVLVDLRGHEPGRILMLLSVGTLIIAVGAGQLVGNAWADRYTATAFVPFLLVLALGTERLLDRRVLGTALVLLALLGDVSGARAVRKERTQAAEVASVLRTQARPGDVVLYCPDQLGPAVAREIEGGRTPAGLRHHSIPTWAPPGRVDWADYAARNKAADGGALAHRALVEAGATHTVWLVFNGEYRTYEALCPNVRQALNEQRTVIQVLAAKSPDESTERDEVYRYAPSTKK